MNCNLSYIDLTATSLYVDTTNAKINLFFSGNGDPSKSEYALSSGSTQLIRLHCSSSSVSSPCRPTAGVITWAGFQKTCSSSGSTADAICSSAGITNRPYDTGDLLNMFTLGTGTFALNGGAAGAGYNVYAPNATLSLTGGGSATLDNPNFMGRLWAGTIRLTGSVVVDTLQGAPGFCQAACPTTGAVYLFDMKVRSMTATSGF